MEIPLPLKRDRDDRLFCGKLEEEAAIRIDIFSGQVSISVANRRFFLLLINYIPVIPSASEGSSSLILQLT